MNAHTVTQQIQSATGDHRSAVYRDGRGGWLATSRTGSGCAVVICHGLTLSDLSRRISVIFNPHSMADKPALDGGFSLGKK